MNTTQYRIVQPWGRDRGRQATLISNHASVEAAFAEIDRLAAQMMRTGVRPDAVELIVVDAESQIVRRPES